MNVGGMALAQHTSSRLSLLSSSRLYATTAKWEKPDMSRTTTEAETAKRLKQHDTSEVSTRAWLIIGGTVAATVAFLIMELNPGSASGEERVIDTRPPGDTRNVKTMVGEYSAELLQSHAPLKAAHTHVTSIMLFADDQNKQIITHGYIAHLNEDVMYELLYDSDKSDAKLLGIKYIITEKLFKSVPEFEKKFWTSNAYAVRSGITVAPGLPWTMEHKLMSDLAPTYSKAMSMWDVYRDPLPFGAPSLLITPTHDGQVNPRLIQERDARLGVNTAKEKEHRRDIPMPRLQPGSDAWETDGAIQFRAMPVSGKESPKQVRKVPTQ